MSKILELAREAGAYYTYVDPHTGRESLSLPERCFERFAALVAAAEREECAAIVEADKVLEPKTPYQIQYNQGITAVAEKIRARGNHV